MENNTMKLQFKNHIDKLAAIRAMSPRITERRKVVIRPARLQGNPEYLAAKYAYPMFLQLTSDELTDLLNFRPDLRYARHRYAGDCLEAMRACRVEMFRMYPKDEHEKLYEWMADSADSINDVRIQIYNSVFRLLSRHTEDPALATRCKLFSDFSIQTAHIYTVITGKECKRIGKLVDAVVRWLGSRFIATDGEITMDQINETISKYTKHFINTIESKTK